MRPTGTPTTAGDAAGIRDCPRSLTGADLFAGHLRVRQYAAEERRGLERLFPDRDRSRWVMQTIRCGRAWILAVEIFENGKWVPLGHAIVDTGGQIALCILPRYRGRGLSPAAIRAVLHTMREYTLTVLTARVSEAEPAAARAFERAGFIFSGQSVSAGRIERLYSFSIRGECTPFNVWI